MSEQHTTGLLKLHTKYPKDIVTPDGHYTVARTLPQPTIAVAVANARRLVACWNKFDGISIENIEDNLPVKELANHYHKALRERNELLDAQPFPRQLGVRYEQHGK